MKKDSTTQPKTVKSRIKKNAGLSLPISPLFEVAGNTSIYYNESPFIARLKRIKFKFVRFTRPFSFFITFGKFPKILKTSNGSHLFESVEHHPLQPSLF